jgi:hypothetical protein
VKELYHWAGDSKQLLAGDQLKDFGNGPEYTTSWYITDQQGSVRKVISYSGAPVGEMGYDAFGNRIDTQAGTLHVDLAQPAPQTPVYESLSVATNSGLSFSNWVQDDLAVIMDASERISVSHDGSSWTVTLPDDAILLRNTGWYWGLNNAGNQPVTIRNVSNTCNFTIAPYTTAQIADFSNPAKTAHPFATRDASDGVSFSEMQGRGWVDGK